MVSTITNESVQAVEVVHSTKPTATPNVTHKEARQMFDQGKIQQSYKFMAEKIETLQAGDGGIELIKLRLLYAKLLLKAGFLVETREQLDTEILSQADVPAPDDDKSAASRFPTRWGPEPEI